MYAEIEKPKGNKSKAVANSIDKKREVKALGRFVDNRTGNKQIIKPKFNYETKGIKNPVFQMNGNDEALKKVTSYLKAIGASDEIINNLKIKIIDPDESKFENCHHYTLDKKEVNQSNFLKESNDTAKKILVFLKEGAVYHSAIDMSNGRIRHTFPDQPIWECNKKEYENFQSNQMTLNLPTDTNTLKLMNRIKYLPDKRITKVRSLIKKIVKISIEKGIYEQVIKVVNKWHDTAETELENWEKEDFQLWKTKHMRFNDAVNWGYERYIEIAEKNYENEFKKQEKKLYLKIKRDCGVVIWGIVMEDPSITTGKSPHYEDKSN